jgi:archaemetzincin
VANVNDLERIAGDLAAEFDGGVRILDPLPEPASAFDAARRQYSSTVFLSELAQSSGPADRVLGVTERDLFIPMLSFVFGQAQLGGRIAVVSLARLRQEFYGLPPSPAVFALRARKEALHELGHTFGLIHCADRRCPMSLSTGIAQVDAKGDRYCTACAAQLRDWGARLTFLEKFV